MKVLFVKLSSLGDIVQAMPLIDAAYEKGIAVDWLVEEQNKAILENHPYLNKLITVCRLKPSNISRIRESIKKLRKNRYDAVIDLQGLLKSAFWVFFAKSEKKIGQRNCRESLARAVLTDALFFEGAAINRYFYLFSKGIFDNNDIRVTEKITINLSGTEINFIDNLIKKEYVVLAPSSRWKSKLWIAQYWKELIKLLSELNLAIFIVGSKEDRKISEFIIQGSNAIDLTGKITLRELFYLFKNARLAITLDSGAMHLAAAAGTKLISLFGATDPSLTGTIDKSGIISSEISCSPCLKRNCPIDNECMRLITPEAVFRKARLYLDLKDS